MKRFKKIIAIVLVCLFVFPFLGASCNVGGNTNGSGGSQGGSQSGGSQGGSQGGSGGSEGGSGGGDENTGNEDELQYYDFSQAISGVKSSYILNDADKSTQDYELFFDNALESTENLAKDILLRLYGVYGQEDKVNLDEISQNLSVGYTPSENLYLKDYNNEYSPAFINNTQDMQISFNIADYYTIVNDLGQYNGQEISFTTSPEGYASIADAVFYIKFDNECVDYLDRYNEETGVLTVKPNEKVVFKQYNQEFYDEDNDLLYDVAYKVRIEPLTANLNYSHKGSIYTEGASTNWNWSDSLFSSSATNFAGFHYHKQLTVALLMLMSGKTIYDTNSADYQKFIEYYEKILLNVNDNYETIINECIKDIKHYGVTAEFENGFSSALIEKIVQFVLNVIIGKRNVVNDQTLFYQKDGNEYVKANNYVLVDDYDYKTTVRYNNANLNSRNGNILAVNKNNYNATVLELEKFSFDEIIMQQVAYDTTKELENPKGFNIGVDYSSAVNKLYGEFNNYEDYVTESGWVNNFNSNVCNFLIDCNFRNYINTVEILVSTACNAITKNADNNYESRYPVINANTFFVYYNSKSVDPSTDDGGENMLASGQQKYQSLVLYSGTDVLTEYYFTFAYLYFESLQGVNSGLDIYVRYHRENQGFANFKYDDGTVSSMYYAGNVVIPAGSLEYLEINGISQAEFEIDFEEILSHRLIKENGEYVYEDYKVKAYSKWEEKQAFFNATENCNKANMVTSVNDCYGAVKIMHSKGEEIEILGYNNYKEEYIEILFVNQNDTKFNYGFYITEMLA